MAVVYGICVAPAKAQRGSGQGRGHVFLPLGGHHWNTGGGGEQVAQEGNGELQVFCNALGRLAAVMLLNDARHEIYEARWEQPAACMLCDLSSPCSSLQGSRRNKELDGSSDGDELEAENLRL